MKIFCKALCCTVICYSFYLPMLQGSNTTYLKTYNSNATTTTIMENKLDAMVKNSDNIKEIDCSENSTSTIVDDYSKTVNQPKVSDEKNTVKQLLEEVRPKPETAIVKGKEVTVKEIREKEEQRDFKKKAAVATQTVAVNIRDYELNELYRIVEAESGDQPIQGRELVAKVVLNRVKSEAFPNNIHDVIFQKNQFSPILDGQYWRVTPSDITKKAVDNVLQGKSTIDSQGALFFMQEEAASQSGAAYIRTRQFLFKYGCHSFWK